MLPDFGWQFLLALLFPSVPGPVFVTLPVRGGEALPKFGQKVFSPRSLQPWFVSLLWLTSAASPTTY